jgi:hypothetical protein
MSKFSDIAEGTRARHPATLPLPGARVNAETGEWEGPTVALDLRALREDEYVQVLERARAFAVARGVAHPEPGDDIFERGKMVHTLAVACIDKDSPPEAPAPFFDGGWESIHRASNLTPEVVAYLALKQALFQDEVNPLATSQSPAEFMAAVIKTAGGDLGFFVNSRPGLQWSFTRTLASQLLALLADRSLSSSAPEPPPTAH